MLALRLAGTLGIVALLSSIAGCGQMPTLSAPSAPSVSPSLNSAGLSTDVALAARAATVHMCHITSEDTILTQDGDEVLGLVGHVIFISPAAEAAHCGHGDHTPRPEKVVGDVCQRPIDRPTPNVTCAGEEQLVRPRWATPADF